MHNAQDFLDLHGWGDATQTSLLGDASARTYHRLSHLDHGSALLMRVPPGMDGMLDRVLRITDFLRKAGFSAPKILAHDAANGLCLIEDFGERDLAAFVASSSEIEGPAYAAAAKTLADLQTCPPPNNLATPSAAELASMIAPGLSWYASGTDRTRPALSLVQSELERLLAPLVSADPVFCHRDFHSQNLFWLDHRSGAARLGIIDFQDAFLGPRAYDLASLVTDARRDVSAELRATTLAAFAQASNADLSKIKTETAVLSVQRNLRILGVFARLSLKHGKPAYVDLIPRVFGYLAEDLGHPELQGLQALLKEVLPPPSPEHLNRLKAP